MQSIQLKDIAGKTLDLQYIMIVKQNRIWS